MEAGKRFRPMRRVKKELTDTARINYLLNSERIGYLGLHDEEGTYVVPLNYVWHNGKIYFHGSNEGRKYDALLKDHTYCFTVAKEYGTIVDPIPAHTGTAYTSVMVFGKIQLIKDLDEATEVMQVMLDKYVPGYFPQSLAKTHVEKYRSSTGSPTIVHCIIPERITAKEDSASNRELFYPGHKQVLDL